MFCHFAHFAKLDITLWNNDTLCKKHMKIQGKTTFSSLKKPQLPTEKYK